MKATLLLIGKTKEKHFIAAINDYISRIEHYLPFSLVTIPELKNSKNLSEDLQKEREGALILREVQPSDTLILLDEHGKELRSVEFANWLQKKENVAKRVVFAIGGAYGFSPDVYKRANEQLSLSKMTFSHQMVRLIFTEQLYRACTIIKGEPYHHE
ncbi:23S rRNA (pseudouridine(1915)-N(3))-methyltransferase RlmH [Prevotella brunnea]|uniref:Ribosomal RNA large subunit methyltransferase H n=1 Tax=Prevotella brunnea TaxID=2508867 RepID=A0A5C8GIV4_9BACT|nr:23S rRNA (pseudouridine(1915)-N(3))-methyltransferase RlmH [Prevotella brunnea]MDR0186615.1 23S rRNA (pseudouridine(1915)-N(3))-methyltransferase RlmH [Prevotella brunnea]TXJ61861.1 23S rRNA (pseudouridine(1915)-N(3))-methyltransferase RlmH [Prevotella brunnea]